MRNSEGISQVRTGPPGQFSRSMPRTRTLSRYVPRRSSAVLPRARKNCPADCKPQLAGAYCPPLCACIQQIHMLSWLNPYLLPSGRTEKQQVSYYRTIFSLQIGLESKQQVGSTIWEAQMNVHTPLHSFTVTRALIAASYGAYNKAHKIKPWFSSTQSSIKTRFASKKLNFLYYTNSLPPRCKVLIAKYVPFCTFHAPFSEDFSTLTGRQHSRQVNHTALQRLHVWVKGGSTWFNKINLILNLKHFFVSVN